MAEYLQKQKPEPKPMNTWEKIGQQMQSGDAPKIQKDRDVNSMSTFAKLIGKR